MPDNFWLRTFLRSPASARHRLKTSLCAHSLMRYAMLGAVALSILPASALAGSSRLRSTQTQDQANDEAKRPVKVNGRPFRALLFKARRLKDEGALDLSRTLAVTIEADRNTDGTIENVAITGASSSAGLEALTAEFVDALSESRALSFLEGARHVLMDFRLDPTTLAANLSTEVESDAHAARQARAYNALLVVARLSKRGQPVEAVYNNMTVSANGKQLAFKLEMSREAAGNLLLKQISPN